MVALGEWAISQVSGADTAARDRLARSGLAPATGNLTSRSGLYAGGAVTLGSGMSASVAPLRAYIQGTSVALQGGYFCVLDAAKTLTFDDGGASSRTDLIVARVLENTADASGFTKFEVGIVKGTGGGGVPATPANAIKLAEKVIAAGLTAGTGGLGTAPTDKRPPRMVAAGGCVPVLDAADRDTLDVFNGLMVHRLDTNSTEQRVNGAWVPILGQPYFRGNRFGTAIPANTDIAYTATEDTHGGWDGDSYTVKIPGVYRMYQAAKAGSSGIAAGEYVMVKKNGTTVAFPLSNQAAIGAFGGFRWEYAARFALNDSLSVQVPVGFTPQNDSPVENNFLTIEFLRP